jgi:DNA-binding transcriptional MerR regulator
MLIGDLISKTGFSRDTIRFYERQGLIKIGRRDRRTNNYKEYSEDILNDLLTIKRLKNIGFTLVEIGDFLLLAKHNLASCDRISDATTAKLQSIDEKIAELTALRNMITSVFADLTVCCERNLSGKNCGVFDSESDFSRSLRSVLG